MKRLIKGTILNFKIILIIIGVYGVLIDSVMSIERYMFKDLSAYEAIFGYTFQCGIPIIFYLYILNVFLRRFYTANMLVRYEKLSAWIMELIKANLLISIILVGIINLIPIITIGINFNIIEETFNLVYVLFCIFAQILFINMMGLIYIAFIIKKNNNNILIVSIYVIYMITSNVTLIFNNIISGEFYTWINLRNYLLLPMDEDIYFIIRRLILMFSITILLIIYYKEKYVFADADIIYGENKL